MPVFFSTWALTCILLWGAVFRDPPANDHAARLQITSLQLTINEIRARSQQSIQNLRDASDSYDFVASILDLCWLHSAILGHPEFETSQTLRNRRTEISSVLKRAANEIKVTGRERERRGFSDRHQQSPAMTPLTLRTDDGNGEFEHWNFVQSRWMDQWTGGPLGSLGQLSGNFAPPFSDQELIVLITSTVSPGSWRINGGEGTIVYYSPALALVVYNSQQVQDEIQDLLLRLR